MDGIELGISMSKLNTYPKKGDFISIFFSGKLSSRGVEIVNEMSSTSGYKKLLFRDGSSGWHYLAEFDWEYTTQLEFEFKDK